MTAFPSLYPIIYPVSHLFPISLSVKCFECYMGWYKCLFLWLHMFSDSWAAMSLCIHSCSLSEEVYLIKSGRIFKLFENYNLTSTSKHLSIIFPWIEILVFLYANFLKALQWEPCAILCFEYFFQINFQQSLLICAHELMKIKT